MTALTDRGGSVAAIASGRRVPDMPWTGLVDLPEGESDRDYFYVTT